MSIRDRTDADIRHVSWLGGQQWRNVERRRQRRRKRSSSSFLFSSRSSDLTFRRLRHTGRVASWCDERNAVALRRPGTDDKRGRRRGFESRRRPRYVWIAKNLDALAGGLEALVASAPIFRPLHSLFDLAGGFRFLPFGGALLRTLARGELTGRRRLFCLGLLRSRRGWLRGLRRGGLRQRRQRRRDQAGRQQGGEQCFGHESPRFCVACLRLQPTRPKRPSEVVFVRVVAVWRRRLYVR